MASLYRLRIELPDRPGALAGVTSVLADADADVRAVDIHEIDGGRAVDEIVVHAPPDWDGGVVRDALLPMGAVLLSASVVVEAEDPVVRAFRWAAALLPEHPGSPMELGRAVVATANAYAGWVSDVGEGAVHPVGQAALARGGAVVQRTDWLPVEVEGLPEWVWLLAVPDRPHDPSVVAFAVRPSSLRFTAPEVRRVEAVLAFARSCAAAGVARSSPDAAASVIARTA